MAAALAGAFWRVRRRGLTRRATGWPGAGIWGVFPKSDNLTNLLGQPGVDINVDDGLQSGFQLHLHGESQHRYRTAPRPTVQARHRLTGAGKVADTLQLPPDALRAISLHADQQHPPVCRHRFELHLFLQRRHHRRLIRHQPFAGSVLGSGGGGCRYRCGAELVRQRRRQLWTSTPRPS